jgi:hypothetical protein
LGIARRHKFRLEEIHENQGREEKKKLGNFCLPVEEWYVCSRLCSSRSIIVLILLYLDVN